MSTVLRSVLNHTRPFAPRFTRLNQHHANGQSITPTSFSGFGFIASNPLPPKPRVERGLGITEIRGPYYNAAFGPAVLADTLALAGPWVDGLKFSGGAFTLMPTKAVQEMIDIAHKNDVYVSTGGFVEHVLATSNDRVRDVERYVRRCKDLGFDVIELSAGFLSLPVHDWADMVQMVHHVGLKAKPELGIQWGAGGDAATADLESIGTSDVGGLVDAGKTLLDAGADILMIESEGITENVKSWRTGKSTLCQLHQAKMFNTFVQMSYRPSLARFLWKRLCSKQPILRSSNGISKITERMSTFSWIIHKQSN